jgi:7-cyano-7-deazaguanine synthase in queuosine biosynthesis
MNIFEYELIRSTLKEYNCTITDIVTTLENTDGIKYKVCRIELVEAIKDYSLLLSVEKHLTTSLGWYNKNIILELL